MEMLFIILVLQDYYSDYSSEHYDIGHDDVHHDDELLYDADQHEDEFDLPPEIFGPLMQVIMTISMGIL